MAIAAARKEYGDRKARIEPLDIEFQAEYDKDGKAWARLYGKGKSIPGYKRATNRKSYERN